MLVMFVFACVCLCMFVYACVWLCLLAYGCECWCICACFLVILRKFAYVCVCCVWLRMVVYV